MDREEIKLIWKDYDRRLESVQVMNERLIMSMLTERSGVRFARVKRSYIAGFIWMSVCLLFGFAVLAGNPFDYQLPVQYFPFILYCSCLIILTATMYSSFLALRKITLTQFNIEESLRKIIGVYEKPRRYIKYTLIVFLFTQVVLLPLSFLPQNVWRMGLWPAVAERMIPIGISCLVLFIAIRLGAFKERQAPAFRADLSELEELRSIASELCREE